MARGSMSVVDSNLKVYRIENLASVDQQIYSSVFFQQQCSPAPESDSQDDQCKDQPGR